MLGVLPWARGMWLDSEDSVVVEDAGLVGSSAARPLRVAVVRLPRISNFTDVDPLALEPGVEVTYADTPRALGSADLVVLPGTRSTLADLAWIRERGLADAVVRHAARGAAVLGVCGGFQMLGRRIEDPDGVEAAAGTAVAGLGLLPVDTVFGHDKVLGLPTGSALGAATGGYEIHHGRVRAHGGRPFLDGVRDGAVFGTMWHGSLEGDPFRVAFLAEVAAAVGVGFAPGGVSFAAAREQRLDRLADLVEEHLDMAAILRLVTDGVPPALPVLSGALG